jgi:hypothetical protein
MSTNKLNITILILITCLSFNCTKGDDTKPDDITTLRGRWDMTFFKNGVQEPTKENYYWTFQNDTLLTYSNKQMITTDELLSFVTQSNHYRIYTYNDYVQLSIDYKLSLEKNNLTQKDSPYIFVFNGSTLNYRTSSTRYIYMVAMGCKKLEKTSIVLFPFQKEIPIEIHLDKK